MPPIPVYTQSPIRAAKPSGVTPQTTSPDDHNMSNTNQLPGYTPAKPTPTQPHADQNQNPPPPQPGAVPRLPTATATVTAPGVAAPEPTAAPVLPGTTAPIPAQISIPAPTVNHAQRGTATAYANPSQYRGYQQNTGTNTTIGVEVGGRASGTGTGTGNYSATGNGTDGDRAEGQGEGVWESAIKWAQAAGKKLSDAESEVWRRVNGEGK